MESRDFLFELSFQMRLSSKDPIIFKSNQNEADNFTEEKQFMEHKTEDTKNAYCASET